MGIATYDLRLMLKAKYIERQGKQIELVIGQCMDECGLVFESLSDVVVRMAHSLTVPAVGVLCAVVTGCEQNSGGAASSCNTETPSVIYAHDLPEVHNYRSWAAWNSKPTRISTYQSTDCLYNPNPASASVHAGKYIRVFANELAGAKVLPRTSLHLPGSVIVKEKLATEDSESPVAIAVMIKREPGYDIEGRDWEYLYFEGERLQLNGRGQLTNCRECHIRAAATDCLYREPGRSSRY